MKYQISRHIEAQYDEVDRDKVLLENLYHGTRLLGGDEIWDVLSHYESPSEPMDGPLHKRVVQAKLVEPVEEIAVSTELKESFDEVSAKVLRYRKVEPSPDLDERLTQLRETCRPLSSQQPIDYFIWHDPSLVFNVMLEHFRVYLKAEFSSVQTSSVKVDFLRRSLGRPPRQNSLEQQVCTLDTTWRRAERITGGLSPEARILVVGDDDLVSVALSCFPTDTINVLELDTLLVRLLKKQGGDRLKVRRHDLANGLPDGFDGQFDVVISDPMYSTQGMSMFLAACSEALRPGPDSRLYLTTYPPLLENPGGFPGLLASFELEVLNTQENFSRYPFPQDMRQGALEGLQALGYHPQLSQILLQVPYLYAHLFECRLEAK